MDEPLEVRFGGGFGIQDEELGQFVGVHLTDPGFDAVQVFRCGLDQQQNLRGVLHSALPSIDRREPRDEIDAGGETLVDEYASNALGFVARTGGGENEAHM